MDGKDVTLIRLLQADGRASYESLGRKLGLSGTAVRTRMNSLQAENVIPGFGLQVSPAIFDRQRVTLELENAFTHGHEEDMMDCINTLPWSDAVFNRDESLALFIWFESKKDLRRSKAFIMQEVSNCSSRHVDVAREFYGYYLSERPRRTKITKTEKQVIRALNLGPRDPMKTVAERCHRSQ